MDQSRKFCLLARGYLHGTKNLINYGLKVLENQNELDNPLSKFNDMNELTELEKLQYENLLLRIENER